MKSSSSFSSKQPNQKSKTMSRNQTNSYLSSTLSNLNSYSHSHKQVMKTQNELLELQLTNSRLQNELIICNEKNKTLNNIINIKSTEIDILNRKYTSLLEEMKQENLILKQKITNEINNNKYFMLSQALFSLLNICIDICDIFFQRKFNNYNINYFSLNACDSFQCNDDNKVVFIEQIQSLLLKKIKLYKEQFDINIEQIQIDKIKSWNLNMIISQVSPINYKSNINSQQKKFIGCNDDINISKIYVSSYDNSNDFDLSVSGQFYNQNNVSVISPKFNYDDVEKKIKKNNVNGFCSDEIIMKNKGNVVMNNGINAFVCDKKENNYIQSIWEINNEGIYCKRNNISAINGMNGRLKSFSLEKV
jgi:hypothetical protein